MDFPKLKRCMAILYETLRLKTPVAEVKWTGEKTQALRLGNETLSIPPGTLIIPSYIYVQRHSRFRGSDTQNWAPKRWIRASDANQTSQPAQELNKELRKSEEGFIEKPRHVDHAEVLMQPPSRGNFLGWSEGARDCPGKRFSQVEWVALMAALFRDWKVEIRLEENESLSEAQERTRRFIDENTDYGGLLLQLMHPEQLPLVWSPRT